jgi:hypothetical protein
MDPRIGFPQVSGGKMSKPTPGPWKVVDFSQSENLIFIAENKSNGMCIADINTNEHEGSFLANARLIAAAPDLLEAMRSVAIADRLNISEWNAAMRLVDAAIAKANGEDQ